MKKTWKPILSCSSRCASPLAQRRAQSLSGVQAQRSTANWLLKNVAVDPADQEPDNIVDWAAFALAEADLPN